MVDFFKVKLSFFCASILLLLPLQSHAEFSCKYGEALSGFVVKALVSEKGEERLFVRGGVPFGEVKDYYLLLEGYSSDFISYDFLKNSYYYGSSLNICIVKNGSAGKLHSVSLSPKG